MKKIFIVLVIICSTFYCTVIAGTGAITTSEDSRAEVKDGKTRLSTITTTSIYTKRNHEAGVIETITTIVIHIYDRKNKTSRTITKVSRKITPLKKKNSKGDKK